MKNKLVTLLLFLIFLVDCSRPQKLDGREAVISDLVIQRLQLVHYEPARLNDTFSQKVFKAYIDQLDFDKRFLLSSDVKALKKFETKIDDQIEYGEVDLLKAANKVLKERILEAQKIYQEQLSKNFDYSKPEELELDAKKRKYCNSHADLQNRWRKLIKYQVLLQYINALKVKQTEKKYPNLASARAKTNQKKLIAEAKKKVKKNLKVYFKRKLERQIHDEISVYVNAIASVYDPHTLYLAPQKKEDFDIGLSGKLEGIGALLREADGYIKVVRIVPGSASWRQKELKAEDIILKVAQGSKQPVDIVGARIGDAVRLIRGKKGTEVRLTVKKPDGQIVVIPIVRDVVIVEETYAKSAIINHKGLNKKFGYIYLPKFYRDFNKSNARNASDDIRKELIKMNENKIGSVILDLRNNGGGALKDAVDASGLFIESGPIVQIKRQSGPAHVLKDQDPAIVYKGKVVVLVNKFSASASEILAGALQDYGRAIIVGSDSTFGKGTVQSVIDLDRFASASSLAYRPLGALKYTLQKFYRVNGESTQYKGVVPDIILPDTFGHLDVGEKSLDYSMKWDKVDKLKFTPWSEKAFNKQVLNNKSVTRRNASPRFQMIYKNMQRFKKRKDQTQQKLNLKGLLVEQDRLAAENKKYDSLDKPITHMKIERVPVEGKLVPLTKGRAESLKDWHKQLTKDTYLQEAVYILNDMAAGQ